MIKKTYYLSFLCVYCLPFAARQLPRRPLGTGQIAVSNSTIQVDYPNSLTFSCHVQNNTKITDIRLEYQVAPNEFCPGHERSSSNF